MSPHPTVPSERNVHLLSNGRYAVMLTDAAAGYSRCGDLALTRWREDPSRDPWASHLLIADAASGERLAFGSAAAGSNADAPAQTRDGVYTLRRTRGELAATLDVLVTRGIDAECRLLSIENASGQARDVAVTSYAELVLGAVARTMRIRLFRRCSCAPNGARRRAASCWPRGANAVPTMPASGPRISCK